MASISDYIKGLQADYAKNNIYSQLGGGILGADVNIKGGSPWTNLATNFVKGLLGGGLNQYGISENREYDRGISSVFGNVLGGNAAPTEVEGLSGSELESLVNAANIFQTGQATDIANLGLIEKAKLGGQLEAQQEALDARRKAILGDTTPTKTDDTTGSPDTTTGSPGTKLRKSLEQKRQDAVLEAQLLGVTPGDYNEYATNKLKLETKDTERALKDLAAKRESSRMLDEIAIEADMAIKKAGNTGGLGGGVKRFGDSVLSIIPGLGDVADQRMAGDSLLDSLAQKGISLNRVAGSGALSDFESRALFDAFLGKDKTPAQNQAILDKIVRTKAVNDEYLSFKENWINNYGSDQGSDVAWQGYKKVAPILVPDQQGQLQFNPMRKPWQEFDLGQLEQLGRTAAPSSNSVTLTPANTQIDLSRYRLDQLEFMRKKGMLP